MIASILQLVGLVLLVVGAAIAIGVGGLLGAGGCALIYLGLAMEAD